MASGPTRDVKEFQFKVSGQLRVFSSGDNLSIESPVKLVATASKYGLIFVGTPSGLISIITSNILNNAEIQNKPLNVVTDFPRRSFPLPSQPSHIDVSADNELLAVATYVQNIPVLLIYSVASFASMNVVKKVQMNMSNTIGVRVADLQWNPGVPNIISAVMTDGAVVLFEVKDTSFSLNSLPPTTQAKCLCWSPKGKQVVIGSADGSLSQYKPDLKQVKTFPPPFPFASIVSVHWPSSFQFIAAYVNTSVPHDRPAIFVVNVPKGAQISYIRYDDICFGSLSKRPEYYFIHQQTWNIVVVGCGDSMELSVLGLEPNTANWVHWKQEDSTRAELPLTEDKDDVHNVGVVLDTSPSQPIQLNETLSIDPMPIVLSLSHDGVLCLFTALNLLPKVACVCSPTQPFPDQSGLLLYTSIQGNSQVPAQIQPQSSDSSLQPLSQTVPSFSQANPMTSFASISTTQSPNLFTQNSYPFSAPFVSQPSFNSGFASSIQSPLFSNTTPFSQSSSTPPKAAPTFPSLIPPMKEESPAFSQASIPSVLGTQPVSSTIPSQPVISTPVQANKGLLSTASTISSFGSLSHQDTVLSSGLTKLADTQINTPQTKPTFYKGSGFGFDSAQPVNKDQVKTEIKALGEAIVSVINQPIPEKTITEEKKDSVEIDNAVYMAATVDELKSFQEEFSGVRQCLNTFKVKIQEEKVKGELCAKMDCYEEFCNELVETTQAQSAEVSSLRKSLLEILSSIELIQTKQSIRKNSSLIQMKEAEEMDPIGKYWCKRIEQHLYYLQSQVKQAVEQIESIKNSNKGDLYLPTFEAVLQTLITQNKIVDTYKGITSSLEDQLSIKMNKFEHRKKKIIYPSQPTQKKVVDDSQLSKLAQKLLQTKLEESEDVSYSYRQSSQMMIEKGVNTSSEFNLLKEQMLRDWFKNHKIIRTKLKPCSELHSPVTPAVKLSKKKPVSFTKEKLESPKPVMAKPAPATPLSRPVNKSGEVNRNLFAPSSDNSISSSVPPNHDVKGVFHGGVTSAPLPIRKDKSGTNGISSSQSISTTANTEALQVPVNASPTLPRASIFGPLSSQPLQTSASTSVQPSKPVDQTPKVIGFGNSQNPPIFSFGTANKENISSENQPVSSVSLNNPSFSLPIPKTSGIFGNLKQPVDNKSSTEESGPMLGFTNESLTADSFSVKYQTNSSEKQTAPSEVKTSMASSSVQPFSFGGLSISTPNSATASTIEISSVASPTLFSFNQSSAPSNTSINQQTTTVSSEVKPISSFSFSSFSSSLKSPSTVPTSVSQSSFSFGMSVPSTTEADTTVLPVSTTPTPTVVTSAVPIASVTPIVTSTVPPLTQSSSIVTTASSSIAVSSSVARPSIFGGPVTVTSATSTATSAISTVTSTPTSTTTVSDLTTPSFKTAATSAQEFTSSFGSFTTTTSAPGLFSPSAMKFSTATTNAAPIFNLPISTATSAPLFNQVATTTPPTFGQAITSTQAPSSPFGQTTLTQSTTPNSPFSQPTTTYSTTTSSFGSSSAFGSNSVFSSLSNPSFVGGSTFGTPTTTQSVFGSPVVTTTASSLFNTPLFGQTSPNTASPFGSVTGQASPFSATTPSTQAPASPFGSTTPPSNPFFNQSQNLVFGQPSSPGNFGSSGGSMFGSSSSFGASSQGAQFQSSVGGSNIFGGVSGGGPFSSGGGQTVGQAGFGAPPSFQSPKPTTGTFGNSAVFGSSPSFGGAPTFGSPSSFGSPNKVFGGTSPVSPGGGGGFGGQNNMFESLANQNTMSFGNLAQTQQPTNMPTTFGSPQQPQPTNPSFGGNAFSSWR